MYVSASIIALLLTAVSATPYPAPAAKAAPQPAPASGAIKSLSELKTGVQNASFTWNANCGGTVACGPNAAGVQGVGAAALNTQAYEDGKPIVNGVGGACGQCWHLQPLTDVYPNNNHLSVGTPIVVQINDQCPDGGYCMQSPQAPLNNYQMQLHFDLCQQTGVAKAFFGDIPEGVLLGVAEFDPTCAGLHDGKFGASQGPLV